MWNRRCRSLIGPFTTWSFFTEQLLDVDQPASPLLLFCPRLVFSILKPSPNKVGKVLKLEVKPVISWAFQGPWAQIGVTTWAAIAGGAKRQKLRGMLAKGLQSWSIPIRFFISLLKYLRKSQWLKKNCVQRTDDNEKRKNLRIVGGCAAGHTPWFVFLSITGG